MAADLESPFFEACRWLVEIANGAAEAVLLVFFGLQTPSVLVSGDHNSMRRLLHRYGPELPARYYTKLTKAEMEIFSGAYRFSHIEELDVMVLNQTRPPQSFEAVEVRLILPADPIEPILNVYRDYPGNFFEPSQLQAGVYAGAWVQGQLAAVAGTHAYAPGEGIAVLGNITTAAPFRGQGLCKAVTSFLCAELQSRGCGLIGLHVATDNTAAIACYRKCGFMRDRSVFQMLAERRDR